MSKPRGFATLTPEKRAEIGRLGGKAAHAAGTAHKFTAEEAREAGRKGGHAAKKTKQAKRDAAMAPFENEPDMLGSDCAITENLERLNGE